MLLNNLGGPAGERSVAKRVLRGAAGQLSNAASARAFAAADTDEQLRTAAEAHGPDYPPLQRMADLVLSPAANAAARLGFSFFAAVYNLV